MHRRVLAFLSLGLVLTCALGTWAALRAATVYASLAALLPAARELAEERPAPSVPAPPLLARWAKAADVAARARATDTATGPAFDDDWREVARGLAQPPPLWLHPPLPRASTSGAEEAADALHEAAARTTATNNPDGAVRASLAGLAVAGAIIVAGDGRAGVSMARARAASITAERAARDLLEALRVQGFAPSSLPGPLKRRLEETDRLFPIVARALTRERLVLPGAAASLLAGGSPLPVEIDPAVLAERVAALLPDPTTFRMPFATAVVSAASGPEAPIERLRSRYRLTGGVPSFVGTLVLMAETLTDESTPLINVALVTQAPVRALTIFERETRARALLREAYVCVALTATREVRGTWPLSLDDLDDGWQRDMTLDPWTGRPFIFEASDSSGITVTTGLASR